MLLQTLALWPAAAIPIVPAPNTMAFSPLRVKECRAARQPIVSGFGRNGIWNFIGLFSQFCVRDQYIFGKAAPPPCTLGISLREDRVGVHAVPARISFTFLPT